MHIPERRRFKYQTNVDHPEERHLFDFFISEIAAIYPAPL